MLKKGPANQGKAIHHSKPTSALSKHTHVTKPESRHGTSHKYSLGQAESMLKKAHS